MPISLFDQKHEISQGARIKVVGVGGGGGNILNSMVQKGILDVEFVAINTDVQALNNNNADSKIQIGRTLTNGLGTGMDKEKGEKAAEENREDVERALRGSDMVFVTAGMGGGTGTGAAPVVAKIAKSLGALVVAIVTKPFEFEGQQRMEFAHAGLEKLKKEVDSMIIIPNQRILSLINKETSRKEAFENVNRVLYNATRGISQIITTTGEVNVDFADVRTIMSDKGDAMIGMGIATGEDRAEKAAYASLSNPILEDVNIAGSKSVLVNILTNGEEKMSELDTIFKIIQEAAGDQANYILGWANDSNLGDEIIVTVIATGFKSSASSRSTKVYDTFKDITGIGKTTVIIDKPIKKEPEPVIEKVSSETGYDHFGKKVENKYQPRFSGMVTEKELDELNIPAYMRNGIKLDDNLEEPEIKDDNNISTDIGLDDFLNDDEYNEPSFFRKQSQ